MLNTTYQSSSLFSFREKNFEVGFLCSYVPTCDQLVILGAEPVLTPLALYNKLGRGPHVDAKHQISKLYAFQFRGEEF